MKTGIVGVSELELELSRKQLNRADRFIEKMYGTRSPDRTGKNKSTNRNRKDRFGGGKG